VEQELYHVFGPIIRGYELGLGFVSGGPRGQDQVFHKSPQRQKGFTVVGVHGWEQPCVIEADDHFLWPCEADKPGLAVVTAGRQGGLVEDAGQFRGQERIPVIWVSFIFKVGSNDAATPGQPGEEAGRSHGRGCNM
jgi:hypothetical protein